MTARRVVLLVTSPRTPPGLLAWPAWEVLRAADLVVLEEPDSPQRPYLGAAGVPLEPADSPPVTSPTMLASRLVVAEAEAGDVVVVTGSDGGEGMAAALSAAMVRRADAGSPVPEVEVVVASWDAPGARLLDLVAVMDRLRSPGGCPWDAQQTHETLVQYLLEETYETVEAIETGDLEHLREELGDLLLQVVFHARIGEEAGDERWSIDDVAAGIVEKLIRRHPHVFDPDDGKSVTAEHVEASWEILKATEKQRRSALDGVPVGLPALLLAAKLLGRASRVGLDALVEPLDPPADPAALGDLLLRLVAGARARGVDAEAALRDACRRFAVAVRASETSRPTA